MSRLIAAAVAIYLLTCIACGQPTSACEVGAMRCQGSAIESCREEGEWAFDVRCPGGCVEGSLRPSPLPRAYCSQLAPRVPPVCIPSTVCGSER